MIKKTSRSNVVPITFLTVVTLALCGGCTPIDSSELQTFVEDLLRNAAAAWLP